MGVVDPPIGRKIIGSKWVFKCKVDENGDMERYKARLVARGFNQKYGFDYDETFSPVIRFESIRSVMALGVQYKLHLHQMDVSTAFLNGELSEEVYMRQPEGFVKKGEEHLVCRLNRSIYGLKQSPRCWNHALAGPPTQRNEVQVNFWRLLFVRSHRSRRRGVSCGCVCGRYNTWREK